MSKVAVVYWSGTGNTEAMAEIIAEAARGKGVEVDVWTSAEFNKDKASEYSSIAFGCPSMGAEVLEEEEFQPMWDQVKGSLVGKKIVLFGSYDWGDGEWMRNWEEDTPSGVSESFICNNYPDDDAKNELTIIGENLL